MEFLRRRPALALVALALLLGLAFQGSRGLWDPDEGRYTNVALQMLASGEWISLYRHEDSLHFTKPPLTYWAMAASLATFGWNEWAVRLPNVLAYVLCTWLAFQLGRTFVPGRPWLPALVFATAPLPFGAANWISTDFVLAATEALAVTCFVQARFAGGAPRWLDAMWAAFGLAFLAKGPPALLPLLAIVAFAVHERRGLALLRPLGLLAFALVGLAWFGVVVTRHPGLLDYFLGHEVVARIATDTHNRYPQWYGPFVVYLPTLLLGALPWTAMLLRKPVAERDIAPDARRFLWVWLLLPLAVFCLSRSRLPLYVLPLFVPLALLVASGIARRAPGRGTWIVAAAWVVLLLAAKWGLTLYEHDKDARAFAAKLTALVPAKPREIVFVEDMTRYGLHLYTHAPIAKVSFKPWPKAISDADFDMTLAQSLAQHDGGRVYILKQENQGYFVTALAEAGRTPVALGRIADTRGRAEHTRLVYTLEGDFPAPMR